ncbi:MAG: HAD-IIIC family phosphatase [Sedimentisphaerales bacterium]
MQFLELKKNLKKDFSHFQKVRVAILGDSSTQLLTQVIRGLGYNEKLDLEIFEADYDQIERQIFDLSSDLYRFGPEFVIIFHSAEKLINHFYKLNDEDKLRFADNHIEKLTSLYDTIVSKQSCKILYFNFVEIDDQVFGNYSNKVNGSFLYQLRKINYELMNASQRLKNLFIVDLCALQSYYGYGFIYDSKVYVNADIVFSIDFLPLIGKRLVDTIQAIRGRFKKCLILDLDNILWGGIIGDDGIENIQIGSLGIGKVFTELQMWIKQLKRRGLILAVCSKNQEHIAKEPFESHPDMVLRLDDIAVFVANLDNKVSNIKYIQHVLNIGFDSIVFLDDSAFERDMVRQYLPEVVVPELPEDPAEYLNYLRTLNLFETASYSKEDDKRTLQYQQEAKRHFAREAFVDEEDFLASLNMTATVETFNKFNTPRVAQLTQRSNQFNLRTIRYTEEDVQRIASSEDYYTFAFALRDKFGDYGLISVVILKQQDNALFIDTWIMSCRVLKRGMEKFVLNEMVKFAQEEKKYSRFIGEYIPTAKNGLAKNHYANLGFKENEQGWVLDIDDFQPIKVFIKAEGR